MGYYRSAKVKLALQRMIQDCSKMVNKTHFHTADFVDQVDQRIRVLLAQARGIKKNHEAYATAMRKATFDSREKVDTILEHLQLDGADDSTPSTVLAPQLMTVLLAFYFTK